VDISTLFQWAGTFISRIQFRKGLKAQGIDYRSLPFRDFVAPYAQYLALVVVVFIAGCEFYLACFPFGEKGSVKSFFSSYIAAPLFFLEYFAYKVSVYITIFVCSIELANNDHYHPQFYFKSKIVRTSELDIKESFAFDEEDRLRTAMADQK